MSLLGGLLYLSINGDSNAYRIPRVLHWLGQEQWHWIRTLDVRMNVVCCNFEWLLAPMILFTGTARWAFVINAASFMMLPGLIFSVFTRLGVSRRAAWWWMWLLPSGWCFVLQAGSDSNDSFAAVYALAMVDFALRGWERKQASDLWLSMLAAALTTGVKQTNIPLAALWLVVVLPGARILLARPLATALAVAVSLLVSALPETVLNIQHTGNWQGLPQGTGTSVWNSGSAPWRLIGNVFSIPLQNLVPPFFPPAHAWDRAMQRFLETPFGTHFATLEKFGHLNMGISEEQAGVGLGISLLTLVSLVWAHGFSSNAPDERKNLEARFVRWIRLTPWILLLAFMAEICIYEEARLLAAYYPLLFPLLLAGLAHARLVRQPWWQWFGLSVMLLAAAMLVVSRQRPLFPEQMIIAKLEAMYPRAKIFPYVDAAYASPRSIVNVENYFDHDIPRSERVIGYATSVGICEPGLWRPFGERRVKRILPDDSPEELRREGIRYVLVDDIGLQAIPMTIDQWTQRYNGTLVTQLAFLPDRHSPLAHVYLVILGSSTAGSPSGLSAEF